MTLAADMTTDLGVFFNASDFGTVASFKHGSADAVAITVIFDDEFKAVNPALGEVESSAPQAECKASDVSTAVHDDLLTVNSIAYKIIGIQPSFDGRTTILILSRD